jgi:hypothetical protein
MVPKQVWNNRHLFTPISDRRPTAVIPTFTSTPSAELNDALEHFRNELFIPLGLPKRQQKSVFKPKYAEQLAHEPITVTINGNEEFTLTPKLRHELPSKKEALKILDIMVATGDFSNLFAFLSGLRMANYSINSNRWEYIIRKVSMAGKLSTIVECARQYNRTGLSLADINIARRLFFELHQTAMRANFDRKTSAYALNLAQQAAALMDAPEHSFRAIYKDPKHQPFVIGTLLELSAAVVLAKAQLPDTSIKAETAVLRDYAQKLDASWPRGKFENDAESAEENMLRVLENLAIYNGMRLSLQCPRALQVTESFQARCDQLKPVLLEQLSKINNHQVVNDQVCQQLKAEA